MEANAANEASVVLVRAVWTASALAAGSVFAAAFSLPFWVAGALFPAATGTFGAW